MRVHVAFLILLLLNLCALAQPREEKYSNGNTKAIENVKNGMQHGAAT